MVPAEDNVENYFNWIDDTEDEEEECREELVYGERFTGSLLLHVWFTNSVQPVPRQLKYDSTYNLFIFDLTDSASPSLRFLCTRAAYHWTWRGAWSWEGRPNHILSLRTSFQPSDKYFWWSLVQIQGVPELGVPKQTFITFLIFWPRDLKL